MKFGTLSLNICKGKESNDTNVILVADDLGIYHGHG